MRKSLEVVLGSSLEDKLGREGSLGKVYLSEGEGSQVLSGDGLSGRERSDRL